MQLVLLEYVAVLQKQQTKNLLEMLQKHQKSYRNFLCIHRKFPANKYDMKIRFFDLSEANIYAEKQLEMAAEKYMAKERDLECRRVSRVDSSSNTIPSETLEVTCKSLEQM
jgi:myosin heavy subunit